MAASVQDLLAAAHATVPKLRPNQVREMIRPPRCGARRRARRTGGAQTGGSARALHIQRGMIEFRADPSTPYHNPALQKAPPTIVLYCARAGPRSRARRCRKWATNRSTTRAE